MDESRALNKILECADLIAMLEDLSSAASRGALSASGISGIKITLRGIREQLLGSHDILAKTVMTKTQNAGMQAPAAAISNIPQARENANIARPMDYSPGTRPVNAIGPDNGTMTRRDLRAMIEKAAES